MTDSGASEGEEPTHKGDEREWEWVVVCKVKKKESNERRAMRTFVLQSLTRTPTLMSVQHTGFHRCVYMKLSASFEVLLQEAHVAGLRKRSKKEQLFTRFTLERKDTFDKSDDPNHFFLLSERQRLVRQTADAVLAPQDCYAIKAGRPLLAQAQKAKVIDAFFPLHSRLPKRQLMKEWVQSTHWTQPLDQIRDYFGDEIALYFAWLQFYTKWLLFPGILGVLLFAYQWVAGIDNIGLALYALALCNWCTFFTEFWRRKEAELGFQWGIQLVPERGTTALQTHGGWSPPEELTERRFPKWKRYVVVACLTIPASAMMLLGVFAIMILALEVSETFDEKDYDTIKYIPIVLYGGILPVYSWVYRHVAVWLNDLEHWRTEHKYRNWLVFKLFFFDFINYFVSLFYIAFYLRDFERLREQMATLLITRAILDNFIESLLPWVQKKLGMKMSVKFAQVEQRVRKKMGKEEAKEGDTDRPGTCTPVEVQWLYKKPYPNTFDDFLEMVVQFGYIALFSPAFPLAAIAALIHNIVELRADAFKLCTSLKRPIVQPAVGIGAWLHILEGISVLSILANVAIVGLTTTQLERLVPTITSTQKVLVVVGAEHALLILKILLSWLIPNQPKWVRRELRRQEHARCVAFKEHQQ